MKNEFRIKRVESGKSVQYFPEYKGFLFWWPVPCAFEYMSNGGPVHAFHTHSVSMAEKFIEDFKAKHIEKKVSIIKYEDK